MSRVMVFGTFDNLHPGHLSYFSQARIFGEELVVIVARDRSVLEKKGRLPQEDEARRANKVRLVLKELGYRGKVALGNIKDHYSVLARFRPDVIALGYDQQVNIKRLKSEISKSRLFCKIKRLRPYQPEKYKSSYCHSDEVSI